MPKSLVIVESPAKARTINRYLGKDYVVKASMGHVRDLPERKLGIDVEHDFRPEYVTIRGKGKIIAELRKYAKSADEVYLATDFDREGEAIAWHLREALDLPAKKVARVTFNEITKKAIKQAFDKPHQIDDNMVNAQQARRVLDRIVGYKLSPLLWKKITKGLSAGRVQSVAVMLIAEREKEIRAFKAEEFWKITAKLIAERGADPQKESFTAELRKINGGNIELKDEKSASTALAAIKKEKFIVEKVDRKQRTEYPRPPFITSTLQQQASTELGFSAKKTMYLAQQLYEGVELGAQGHTALITYMRTDSVHLAADAVEAARGIIAGSFGQQYVPPSPIFYKSKKDAQGAHEAIRPTEPSIDPAEAAKHLSPDLARLYDLIWRRFISCQMNPAVFDVTVADIRAGKYLFKASGRVMKFDGHLRVAGLGGRAEQQILPELVERREVFPVEIIPSQHFTQPPPRYTEATLVRVLEGKGIGRPSTYAPIISTIQERGYVGQRERKFYATELGELVTDKLVAHFPDIINTDFTSRMENNLDLVEEGKTDWVQVLSEFYKLFSSDLERASTEMKSEKGREPQTGIKCDLCGAPMVYRWSKRGRFLGCSKYPECKSTKPLDENGEAMKTEAIDEKCPDCGSPLVVKSGRYGKFAACTKYPDCKFTRAFTPPGQEAAASEEQCPNCGAPMVVKRGRFGQFLACSKYPACKTTKKIGAAGAKSVKPAAPSGEKTQETKEAEPAGEGAEIKCDKCGSPMVVKQGRFGDFLSCSKYPDCKGTKKIGAVVKALKAAQSGQKAQGAKPAGQVTDIKCDKCGSPMVEKMSRRGKFLGCSTYPACTNIMPLSKAAPPEETDEKCPNCGSPMVLRTGRWGKFLACSAYPKCKTTKKI